MYRRKIEKNIKKSLILFLFFKNNLLIFYKNILIQTFAIIKNKCQIKKIR